ncbi:MAG: cation:proton antiporter [Myxococcota bacterium]
MPGDVFPDAAGVSIFLSGGLILVGGAILGLVARVARLPALIGHLAAGVLIGKYGLSLLPEAHGEALSGPVTDLTMALVLFVLGGQFRLDKVRGRERPVLSLALLQSVVTFVLVAGGTWLVLQSIAVAVLLGVLAVEVAPTTTVVVLREYEASGPTSDAIQLVTALSDMLTIVLFELVFLVLVALAGGSVSVAGIAWDVVGSLGLGVLSGYALIVLQDRVGFGNYALPLLTVLLLTIGVCQWTGVPHMLVFLVTGAVVVNRSRFFDPITAAMDNFAQPAYVAFFVLSGWHMDFALLRDHWVLAGVYIVARTLGKLLGARAGERTSGLRMSGGDGRPGRPFGLALLSQAGTAIALAQLAAQYDQALGAQLLNVVLAAAVVFELAGPLLLKQVVVSAGEVQIGQLLTRPGTAPRSWRRSLRRVLRGPWKERGEDVADLTVGQTMRSGVKALSARANMDEMLHYANHSAFNQFPVVDDEGRLCGMIRLKDLSEIVYDPRASDLVIATDVVSIPPEAACLAADDPVAEAARLFDSFAGNTIPVVHDRDSRRYVGVIERAEVLRVMRHIRRDSVAPPGA